MHARFSGKVVLITGAASGIGLAAAIEFALEGATVVATDLDAAALEAARADIAAHGKVATITQDVTDEAAWDAVIASVIAEHGRLDVVVNNAGVGRFVDVEQLSYEEWNRTIKVNLDAVFLGTRAAIRAMKDGGGVIVNMASIESIIAHPLLAAYNASKGGVEQLTKSAALWCAQAGYPVRVVSLHPGFCDTTMVQNGLAEVGEEKAAELSAEVTAKTALGRLATVREIARPLLFLASDDASYITGSGLVVDGGFTAA